MIVAWRGDGPNRRFLTRSCYLIFMPESNRANARKVGQKT